ncbi:MAG: DegT/DnrJ/EryC1/StrS family aminotransferase [Acidobacteria bacterium]|nr:DegT/DnrJ/EryC1/StrS family aminotransferase [Acidobacteriota bacterium]
MTPAPIPLVDLKAQHAEIAAEVEAGFARVIAETAFILGPAVAEFETAFARFCGVPHCLGVGNGTDAIELIVRALGLGPGDEVLVPANTFIATALGVLRAGATPVPVDCDAFFLMDPGQIEARITPRTRALLPVHLFGQIADMEALREIAALRGLALLEDAAQSQGARRHGRASGALGDAAATSFYPGKNLGAYGDGGAVLTASDEIAAHVRKLRNWGSEQKYHHPELGFNSRLDTLQAVVLSAKLRRLEAWNDGRRRAAARYDELLAGLPGVETPRTLAGNEHVWHLYVVRVPRRDEVLAKLNAEGIGAGIHYPTSLHLHGALRFLGYREGDFPVAEKAAREILSLPLDPHITAAQQERVTEILRQAL